MLVVYRSACPSCGGPVSDERLARGGVCRKCLPVLPEDPLHPAVLCERLPEPRQLAPFCEALHRVRRFREQFQQATGHSLLPIQELWIRRFSLGQSFAIAAPPGMGKTTWLLLLALSHPGKTLILVPTRLLAAQVRDRLRAFQSNLSGEREREILLYESRKAAREAFEQGAFDILVGTVQFFHRRFEDLKAFSFGLVVVDDVDAFLRRGRGVERLAELLGFPAWARTLAQRSRLSDRDLQRLARLREQRPTRVVMSSATFRPHPRTVRLFERLLGFDVQQATSTLRNVIDAKEKAPVPQALDRILEVVGILGNGGLLFVSELLGREKVAEVVAHLRAKGLTVLSYHEMEASALFARMRHESFDLAVGLAHPHNPLVRGVDMPGILRYALFLEPPVRRIPLAVEPHPARLLSLLLLMMPILEGEARLQARGYVQRLRPLLGIANKRHQTFLEEVAGFVQAHLLSPGFRDAIESRPDVALTVDNGEPVAWIGDAATYIQATGRTSRLLKGRLTRGFALVLYAHEKAMHSLERRLRLQFMHQEVDFQPLGAVDLEAVRADLDASRRGEGEEVRLTTTLVVVESPTKARTLASFFGRPQARQVDDALVYEIPGETRHLLFTASLGHVTDLVRTEGFFGVRRGGEEGYLPVYDTLKRCLDSGEQWVEMEDVRRVCPDRFRDKKALLSGLRRLAFETSEVVIATDPDAEGEKIAYDLMLWLKPFQPCIRRAEFHEITPRSFREALSSPREVNRDRVRAQLARRILDRWVGFTLSRLLWKAFGDPHLSAGRVQTPVLGWVIARAEEARQKVPEVRWAVGPWVFSRRFDRIAEARTFLEALRQGRYVLRLQEIREDVRHPPPPLTTDRVLVEASRKLGLGARETMALLQELFERGWITYHRTDSTHVSVHGRYQVARPFILERFGEGAFSPRAWDEEGTHEAIRPTRPLPPEDLQEQILAGNWGVRNGDRVVPLYRLIFDTFMASQMRSATVRMGTVVLEAEGVRVEETVHVEVAEPGFYLLAGLPPLFREGPISQAELREVPRARPFTQGELIAEMKRRGLGRPSTYAVIVDTLLARKYIVERGGVLWPTRRGREVYAWLVKHHPELVSEALTRKLETAMDRIERGERSLRDVLQELEGLSRWIPGIRDF